MSVELGSKFVPDKSMSDYCRQERKSIVMRNSVWDSSLPSAVFVHECGNPSALCVHNDLRDKVLLSFEAKNIPEQRIA